MDQAIGAAILCFTVSLVFGGLAWSCFDSWRESERSLGYFPAVVAGLAFIGSLISVGVILDERFEEKQTALVQEVKNIVQNNDTKKEKVNPVECIVLNGKKFCEVDEK